MQYGFSNSADILNSFRCNGLSEVCFFVFFIYSSKYSNKFSAHNVKTVFNLNDIIAIS